MRELKFRAWDKRFLKMQRRLGIDCYDDGSVGIWGDHSGRDTDDFILLQYTGLKDKNGKEIYEGDIVKVTADSDDWNHSTDGIQTIEFWNGQFVFNAHRREEEDDDYINFGWWVRSNNHTNTLHQIEVIGNIYENPELLAVK